MTSDTEKLGSRKYGCSFKKNRSLVDLVCELRKSDVPEEHHIHYIKRYLENRAREENVPLTGTFELTPLCNLDCKMCYVHISHRDYRGTDLISVEQWKSIMRQAHDAGMIYAALSGGECLVHPDFNELYLWLWNMGVLITVMTNGLLVNKGRIDFFIRHRPNLVQVSLYGASDDAYEHVTGHRVYHTIINNIKMLKAASIPVALTITPNAYGKRFLRDTISLAKSLDIPYGINAKLIEPRKETGRQIADLSVDEYIELYRHNALIKGDNLIPVDAVDLHNGDSLDHEFNTNLHTQGLTCGGGRSSFTMKYDGNISPCVGLSQIFISPFKPDFSTAWKRINHEVNQYCVPQECFCCKYRKVCIICPAMHRTSLRDGHCDSEICKLTKSLISLGIIKCNG